MARRYLDEARPSKEYMRSVILNTNNDIGSSNYGKVNWSKVNETPWNSNTTRTRRTTKKKNTKWTPMTQSQAEKSLGETERITIQPGQTLSSIDKNKWRQIAIANGIKDPNKIKAGTELIVPKNRTSVASAAKESTKETSVENKSTVTPTKEEKPSASTVATPATPSKNYASSLGNTKNIFEARTREMIDKVFGPANTKTASPEKTVATQSTTPAKHSVRIPKSELYTAATPKESGGILGYLSSLVPSVNADPSGGYHAYNSEQFWKDRTGTEMPGELRSTVRDNLKVARAGAASIALPAMTYQAGELLAPYSDAAMKTQAGQWIAKVLSSPKTAAALTSYGLGRFPWDVNDGDYFNAVLDVLPAGGEMLKVLKGIATGTRTTRGARILSPTEQATTNINAMSKKEVAALKEAGRKVPESIRLTRSSARGYMPIFDPYTGQLNFVNQNTLQGKYVPSSLMQYFAPETRVTNANQPIQPLQPTGDYAAQARAIMENKINPRFNLSGTRTPINTPGYTSPDIQTRPGVFRVPQVAEQPVQMLNPLDPAVGLQNPQIAAHAMEPRLPGINTFLSPSGNQYNIPQQWLNVSERPAANVASAAKPTPKPRTRTGTASKTKSQSKSKTTKSKTTRQPKTKNGAEQLKIQFSLGGALPLW